jgi:hypothetical protein
MMFQTIRIDTMGFWDKHNFVPLKTLATKPKVKSKTIQERFIEGIEKQIEYIKKLKE